MLATRHLKPSHTQTLLSSFSTLSLNQPPTPERVTILRLNNLSDNPGACPTKRRVGRGIGSSKGKTCGRGHKGLKARSGGRVHPTYEGGQTKFYKRLPKRGFTNAHHREEMLGVNVGTIQDYVTMGRLVPKDNQEPWTMKDLVDCGLLTSNGIKHGVKLLAGGKERLTTPLNLELSRASAAAIEAVEKVGGRITTVHYNPLALRALLKPEKFAVIPKRALPPPKRMVYYTDYDNRGYLSSELQLKRLTEELEQEKNE